MSEPEEVKFACIGCGTWNAAGAEVCAGCGHRFAGTDLIPKVRIALPPRPPENPYEPPSSPIAPPSGPSENPYEPPSSPIAPPRALRIGTALFLIAIVAVCLGALRENIALGVAVILSLAPAAIRTPLVAGRRRAHGLPMDFWEQFASFLTTMVCTWAVVISTSIAFLATCYPAGLVTSNLVVGLVVGVPAAIGCAFLMTRIFVRMGQGQAARDREIRYR